MRFTKSSSTETQKSFDRESSTPARVSAVDGFPPSIEASFALIEGLEAAISQLNDRIDHIAARSRAENAQSQGAVERIKPLLTQLQQRLPDKGLIETAMAIAWEGVQGVRRLGDEATALREDIDRLNGARIRDLSVIRRSDAKIKWPRELRGLNRIVPGKRTETRRLAEEYELLATSVLFDARWYVSNYPDIAAAGIDPILHYLVHGAAEGRYPAPNFDGREYLELNPDVALAGVNPLVHFLRHGFTEQRIFRKTRSIDAPPVTTAAWARTEPSPNPRETGDQPFAIPLLNAAPPSETDVIAPPQIQTIKSEPQFWYYIGDTLEWLQHHSQVTGVGKVSTELFFAALDLIAEAPTLPCVLGETASHLIEVSAAEQYVYLAEKTGRRLGGELKNVESLTGVALRSPEPGDHIFFTGVVWTPTFTELFEHLSASAIEFSVLVYDIIPIEFPELVGENYSRSFSQWLTATIRMASLIYVSNNSVKNKIIRWSLLSGLDLRAEIVVIAYGLREIDRVADATELAGDPQTEKVELKRFVLCVGTIDRRKNQIFLCRIWTRLIDILGEDRTPQLVLAGRSDFKVAEENEQIAALIAGEKIVVLEGLADSEIAGLYRQCLFTAFPSLSEGYGLPVAESLFYGKLCLSSDLPEIREHARDLAWYFSVDDIDGAVALFAKAIGDAEARADAEARIAHKFRPARWTETYRDMTRTAYRTRRRLIIDSENPAPPVTANNANLAPNVALANSSIWCTDVEPAVSIIIVNHNAAPATLECVRQIWAQTDGVTYEIVIADTGSARQDIATLCNLGGGVRLIDLQCDRFFGEVNNIAAEASRGRYLCLLNTGALVESGWLFSLIAPLLANPEIGAAGPMVLSPDGVVQNSAAMINPDGYPVWVGPDDPELSAEIPQPKYVDYIPTAALLVRRDLFLEVGGFDMAYEPACYEDIDLCLKIQAYGRKILYCPQSRVAPLGSSANGDEAAQTRRKALEDINRDKLTARWGEYLRTRDADNVRAIRRGFMPVGAPDPDGATGRKSPMRSAVVYTPYALTPGGGERYLLTLATVLARHYRVKFVTPHPYSYLRLRNLGCEFGLDVSSLILAREADLDGMPAPDLMVTMGNEIIPPIAAYAKSNIYICQFPFPMNRPINTVDKATLSSYETIVVYSEYARAHVYASLSAWQLPARTIRIVYPPVSQIAGNASHKKRIILSVGRFFTSGHSKRHDALIAAFKEVASRFDEPVELHLAGSSAPGREHMDYLASLKASATGFTIHFHVNASAETLNELYRAAAVYWHGTGIGANMTEVPEKAEHFGISLVEAMSAQAIPFALNSGGPREIITDGETGFLYDSVEMLSDLTVRIFSKSSKAQAERMGRAAGDRARAFSTEAFIRRVDDLMREIA